ncbi:TetR/AcrR family transcriptional regulator [Alkalicoccus chagannorensis]|uniref:TetR/AcrR family transcriptional regulator n=1 Tax=Alkalicoccus chagannorensis TaxID=427072 RepID=UPI0003FAEFB2|nr:TetR/AcrR family transcriptional regulator [Alkalicoccus chagannorensis]
MSKKEHLTRAALDVFETIGIRAAPVAKITEAAGMSKGAFYQHFDSKESLVTAVLARYYEELFAVPEEPADGQELLRTRVAREIEHAAAHRHFIFELMTTYPPGGDHGITEAFRGHHHDVFIWRKTALSAAFGARVDHQLHDLTMLIDGMLHSYLQQMLWEDRSFSPYDVSRFIVEAAGAVSHLERPSLPDAPVTTDQLLEACRHAAQTSQLEDVQALLHEAVRQLQQETWQPVVIDTLLARAAAWEANSSIRTLELQWTRWKGVQSHA